MCLVGEYRFEKSSVGFGVLIHAKLVGALSRLILALSRYRRFLVEMKETQQEA